MQLHITLSVRQLLCRNCQAGQSTDFCSRLTSNWWSYCFQLFVIFTKTPTDVQPDAQGIVALQMVMDLWSTELILLSLATLYLKSKQVFAIIVEMVGQR